MYWVSNYQKIKKNKKVNQIKKKAIKKNKFKQ